MTVAGNTAEQVFAEWFGGRHWRVCTGASGTRQKGETVITYEGGRFHIDGGGFLTPFGTPAGSDGWLVQEVGSERPPLAFREDVLRRAEQIYGTVEGLPPVPE